MSDTEQLTKGTLAVGENHPAVHDAYEYVINFLNNNVRESMVMLESFASMALSGNRQAEICHDTLQRIINKQSIGERSLFGLAWTLRGMHEHQSKINHQAAESSGALKDTGSNCN